MIKLISLANFFSIFPLFTQIFPRNKQSPMHESGREKKNMKTGTCVRSDLSASFGVGSARERERVERESGMSVQRLHDLDFGK